MDGQGTKTHFVTGELKISVFRVTCLKILGREGTHIFYFFSGKNNFMHFERQSFKQCSMIFS